MHDPTEIFPRPMQNGFTPDAKRNTPHANPAAWDMTATARAPDASTATPGAAYSASGATRWMPMSWKSFLRSLKLLVKYLSRTT